MALAPSQMFTPSNVRVVVISVAYQEQKAAIDNTIKSYLFVSSTDGRCHTYVPSSTLMLKVKAPVVFGLKD